MPHSATPYMANPQFSFLHATLINTLHGRFTILNPPCLNSTKLFPIDRKNTKKPCHNLSVIAEPLNTLISMLQLHLLSIHFLLRRIFRFQPFQLILDRLASFQELLRRFLLQSHRYGFHQIL